MTGTDVNPYVGPRPLQQGETLYGRDREVRELFHLLKGRRIAVLHSPSGAGKSSLVQAGLVPRLKRERFDVWRTIRLNLDPATSPPSTNRYLASTLASLEAGLPAARRQPFSKLAGSSLAEYLAHRPRHPKAPSSVVLVFDQFEEVLTADLVDVEAKREFFDQLGEALREPLCWALFVVREDYLAALDPYRDRVPTRLDNTFRIDLLGLEAAEEAIVGPARQGGREFPAAGELVSDLAKLQVQQPDGSFVTAAGHHVEPVHLQVVCRRLWQAIPAGDRSIDSDDLKRFGDVNEALAAYYADSVAAIAAGDVSREREVREWVGERLITGGIRSLVRRGPGKSEGLANPLIEKLVHTHLVRAEKRAGVVWYELAHDRLINPVHNDNASWRENRLQPWQRQADRWHREGSDDRYLLRGQELRDAQRWASGHRNETTRYEREFLRRSRSVSVTRTNLADLGWGLILAEDADREVLDALKELLDHRRGEAGGKVEAYYKELVGKDGYRRGETAQDFLLRHRADFGLANPERMPYYLMIVGDPETIPFEFQYELDRDYAVGRVYFETLDDYTRYARSVVTAEKLTPLRRQVTIFGTNHAGDPATSMAMKQFLLPLVEQMRQAKGMDWDIRQVLGQDARKSRLEQLLGGSEKETPAVLLSATHAIIYPPGDPRQAAFTGSLICQDWPGPAERREMSENYFFSAADVSDDAKLLGLIAFLWGSTTAGSPRLSNFPRALREAPKVLTDEAFLARLPQRLLAHPKGGALAVIGKVDVAWSHAYVPDKESSAAESASELEGLQIFASVIGRLMDGHTVGSAMERFNQRYARRFTTFVENLQQYLFQGSGMDDHTLIRSRNAMVDDRNYIVLGDPAVRLAVGEGPGLDERPVVEPVSRLGYYPIAEGTLGVRGFAEEDEAKADEQEDRPHTFRGATRTYDPFGDALGLPFAVPQQEEDALYFTGIDGVTGDYLLPPMGWDEITRIAQGPKLRREKL